MNGKAAKRIRALIYGEDFSPRSRSYTVQKGTILATGRRREYQEAKKKRSRGLLGKNPSVFDLEMRLK